jgi:hypothetical protein
MWIMWVTSEQYADCFVQWGLSPEALVNKATGTSHTYNIGWHGLGEEGWDKEIYQAKMSNLAANTKYFYQFGHAAAGIDSKVYSFKTPGTQSATVAFLADQGTVEPLGSAVAKQIARDCAVAECDAVHIAGDLAYAWHSWTPGSPDNTLWDLYQQV